MNLGFVGNGSMSQVIQLVATERQHKIVGVAEKNQSWDFSKVEMVLECTVPSAFWENIEKLCDIKQDTVIVTTGWYDELDRLKRLVEKSGNRVLWSSNYSVGVNIYFRVIAAAAKLINKAEEYDVWGTEIHHKNKQDSPSGTAKTLEEILLSNIDRKKSVVEETLQRKIKEHEIHFSSTRGGIVNFAHTIGFDSAADCIEIKHSARNREGYALGAVKCAEWLKMQPPGLYTMEDYLQVVFS